MNVDEIGNKIKNLPDHLIPEVLDYIEFLQSKYDSKETGESENKFTFDWEGGLTTFRDKYTSVELQHKAMDWR